MPGISMRLCSWLETIHYGFDAGSLCTRWYVQQAMTALRSLMRREIRPMKPSKPSIVACMSGLESFKPSHALASKHLLEQPRRCRHNLCESRPIYISTSSHSGRKSSTQTHTRRWACVEVAPSQRETSKSNCETSLPKFV